MHASIDESVKPLFFISYSRVQESVARTVRALLGERYASFWLDLEGIVIGDDWRREIHRAIERCDELVLLVSNESVTSKVVREEVDAALAARKVIRPLLIAPLRETLPEFITRHQYVDLTGEVSASRLAGALHLTPGAGVAEGEEKELDPRVRAKVQGCRGVWPRFREALVRPGSPAGALQAELESFLEEYPASSTLRLNSGLLACAAGRWEQGLRRLEEYAAAANSFAGWYFFALHAPRRRPAHRLPPADGKRLAEAADRAAGFGRNPLLALLQVVAEVGHSNLGEERLLRRLQEFAAAERSRPETASEYVRLYWCLQDSFPAFRNHGQSIVDLIRRKARESSPG